MSTATSPAIHPTAVVSPGAELGANVEIGPYAIVEAGARIGDGCKLGPAVHVFGCVELGASSTVRTGSVLGGEPQDLKYKDEPSRVVIGARCRIHEHVTVHRGTGANTLIVGLTTAGGTKDVLLRGVGPTLSQFGVVGALADPQLALFNSSSVETARNDDWGGSAALTASFNIAGAFPLALTSKDAAILTTLTPGSYSAQVTGTAGTTGVVLMESYDSDIGSPLARYTNLSARNQVGTGANILIVGFNLTGSGSKRLLIRAVGPALAQFGVAGVLSDPQAVVFNAAGTEVGRNDDWENTTANQGQSTLIGQASSSVGAFPLPGASRDSAMVVTLEPGSYTVQVSGVNNGTGVALVEIYELP